jgi:hypothetical protein
MHIPSDFKLLGSAANPTWGFCLQTKQLPETESLVFVIDKPPLSNSNPIGISARG